MLYELMKEADDAESFSDRLVVGSLRFRAWPAPLGGGWRDSALGLGGLRCLVDGLLAATDGGSFFSVRKYGSGTLYLAGRNTYGISSYSRRLR